MSARVSATPRFDPVRAVEACYEPRSDDEAWLSGILATLAPLDAGLGRYAKLYDLSDPADLRMQVLAEAGPLPPLRDSTMRIHEFVGLELFRVLHWPTPPVELVSRRMRRFPPEAAGVFESVAAEHGIGDVLGVLGGDHDGKGAMLAIVQRRGARPPAQTIHHLKCVSAHLVAARRLRAATPAGISPEDGGTEAMITPDGRIEHAAGGGRERAVQAILRDAVRRSETARGRLRRADPDEALGLWQGLVDGTWSLVDHTESDGKRYVLVRRNAPGARDPAALRTRERDVAAYAALGHSNKQIGYMLGITTGTVSGELRAAYRKLGFTSRRELIQSLAPRTGDAPAPETIRA